MKKTIKKEREKKGIKRNIQKKKGTRKRQKGGKRFSHGRNNRKSWLYNYFSGNSIRL